MARVFAVLSGKGGVGKTTTAVNLGFAMNSLGQDVVIVDANLDTPNVGIHLGTPVIPNSLKEVLSGKAKIEDAIYEHQTGTKILPASISLDANRTKQENLDRTVKKLKRYFDSIILDSPAGLGQDVENIIKTADEVIIVSNPEIPAVTDALKTITLAEKLSKPVSGVIITRVRRDGKDMPYKNVNLMLEKQIIGIVPEDEKIRDALLARNPIVLTHPKSGASIAYKKIASTLTGIPYKEELTFWSKLSGFFRVK